MNNVDHAQGIMVIVKGKIVQSENKQPIHNALVEIWQACWSGKYNHEKDDNPAPFDPNFQYFATHKTDAEGHYTFKTVIPGAYPARQEWLRPPHIHFKVTYEDYESLITQLYFHPESLVQDVQLNPQHVPDRFIEMAQRPKLSLAGLVNLFSRNFAVNP